MKLFVIVLTCCLALALGYTHEGSSGHTGLGGFGDHDHGTVSKRQWGTAPEHHHNNNHKWTAHLSKRGHFTIDGGVSHSGGDTRVNVGLSYNWKRLAELEKEVADLKKTLYR